MAKQSRRRSGKRSKTTKMANSSSSSSSSSSSATTSTGDGIDYDAVRRRLKNRDTVYSVSVDEEHSGSGSRTRSSSSSSTMSGRTARVPALVLTRSSAGYGGEAGDEGDLPVAFEQPTYSGGLDGGLPLIPLWTDDLAASASDSGTGTAGCRLVGRSDLLLAYYNECGCLRRAGQCNSGRRLPLCSACRNVELSLATYLSREMIRLWSAGDSRFGLAVRGANRAMVRVDGIPVCDEESQCFRDAAADNGGGDNGGGDDWFVGGADLTAGTVLSIECSRGIADGTGTDGTVPAIGRLAFVLQNIDVDLDVNAEEPAVGRRGLVAIIPEREGLARQEIVVKLGGVGLGNNSGGARISTGAAKLSLKPPPTSGHDNIAVSVPVPVPAATTGVSAVPASAEQRRTNQTRTSAASNEVSSNDCAVTFCYYAAYSYSYRIYLL